jgi:methionyl-tRNA synthetase
MSHKISPVCTVNPVAIIVPLLLCVVFALQSAAQNQTIAPPGQNQRTPAETEWEAQQKRAAEKVENAKRQQAIKEDTDKLLELATELKQYVDKTNEHTLSVDVIKKADAIEKLAHTVKEKMKGL